MNKPPLRYMPPNFWMLTNKGNPIAIFMNKRHAIERATSLTDLPWRKAKTFFELRRVEVNEI